MDDRIRELETSLGVALHLLNECREALFVFDQNHPLIARTENFDIALVNDELSQQEE
jgi:hypothetical protein